MQFNSYIVMFIILPQLILGNLIQKDVDPIGEIEIVEVEYNEKIKEVESMEAEYIEHMNITTFDIKGLTLKEGIANEEVLRAKMFLKSKGYESLKEDYYFDKKMKEAIVQYQQDNGINPDGAIGANTYRKINEDMEFNRINIPEIEMEIKTEITKGDIIIINKSNNTLYHLKNKNIIKKYPVATGKSVEYTPEGKFTIVVKYINPPWGGAGISKPIKGGAPNNPLGKRWMGLSIKGGGSYGIHGNANESSIGTYASLGCVRMFNRDVESIYDIIPIGTPVWIGDEGKLKEFGISFNLPKN